MFRHCSYILLYGKKPKVNKRIHLTPSKTIEQQLVLEGNELVMYTFATDSSKPRMWLEGMEYHFNRHLTNVQRVPGRRLPSLVEAYSG